MPSPPSVEEGGTRACYVPALDLVRIPTLGRFGCPEAYYSTLFHELVHSTGHPGRLARASLLQSRDFGDPAYSKEELVAEMGAALLSAELGIAGDGHEASASYVQGWLRVLKAREHRRWIVEAAGQAGKAANLILGRTPAETETAC